MHGGHAENLAPLPPPELGADHAVDAGADGVARLVDEDAGVVVELDDGAVGPLDLLPGPHDDGVPDVAALDLVGRRRGAHAGVRGAALLLDDGYDAVTCRRMWLVKCGVMLGTTLRCGIDDR